MRDAKKRVKQLAEALKLEPGSIPKRLELAAALREVGKPVEAIDLYRGVAEAYAADGRLVQAMAVCKGILEIDREHRDTLEMLADLANRRAARPPLEVPAEQRWVPPTRSSGHDPEETSASGVSKLQSLREQTPHDQPQPLWGSALYEEEDPDYVAGTESFPVPEPTESIRPPSGEAGTVVGRKGSEPRSVDEIRAEADTVMPDQGGEPIAQSTWSDTDRTRAPALPPPPEPNPKPALDFPPEVKALARGDRLLGFTPTPATDVLSTPDPYQSLAHDHDAPSTKAATPKAIEAQPEGNFEEDQATLTWDDDLDNQVVADALAAPFPRAQLEHEPPPFPLLSDLPRQAFVELLARMSVVRLGAGEMVLREGEAGDACYLIVSGTLRVLKAGIDVAHLGPGSFFGEFAVLADQRRHASVETLEPVELLEIRRVLLDELVAAHPGVARTLRAFYRERLMSTLMQTAPFFAQLSPEERKTIAERFRPRRFARGTHIIDEGSAGGGLYLILVGEVIVVRGTKEEVVLGKLGEGCYFGEMSLLKGGVAVATVRASRMTEVVQLPPRDFYEIVSQHPVLWEQLRAEAERREMANLSLLTGEARASGDGSEYLL
jgi:CRP-like cAMP-binding protein